MTTSIQCRSDQMMDDLRAQEIRGMERYATDEPSECWGTEFHRKLALWRRDLAAYEAQEMTDHPRPAPPAAGERKAQV